MIVIKCPECGEETSLPESYGEERFGGEVKSSEGSVRLLVAVIKKGISTILGNTMKKTVLAIIILGLVLLNSVAIAGASPDLTEAGKKYIAENFGIDGCWVYSGLTWDAHSKQGEIVHVSGGTGLFMSGLTCVATDHIVLKTPRTGTFYLSDVVTGNGGNAITDSDIFEIVDNDGYPAGEAQYCICAIPKEVKAYIAKNYGDGNCVTATSPDAFDLACRLGTLTTPLPTGYTSDTLCSGQILDWVYANKGWCISGPIHNLNTGDNFSTIQAAIEDPDTKAGHTVTVDSGTYAENVNVTKRLTLKGIDTGGGKPVIDASGSWSTITLSVDGITLEGFEVTDTSWSNAGIEVISNHNTIRNNNACTNYGQGIRFSYSNNNTISGNTVSNNGEGSYLEYSNNNTITGNTFVNEGLLVRDSYQNTVVDNTVNGKPLVYFEEASDFVVTDAGQVILVNCNNITVEGLDLSNTTVGVVLLETEGCKISNNTVSNSNYGIYFHSSCNNSIVSNTASNNDGGIFLWNSSNNNTITRNTVSYNDLVGIIHWDSNNNKIYLNNFMNNTDNVYSMDSINIWTSTKKITYTYSGSTYKNYLGNYWDDYEEKYPYAQEIDSTGIWNIPYAIESTADNYPLIEQWEKYNKSTALTVHNTDTGKSYSTIQAAIDDYDTKAGHTITVDSEAYFENVNVTKRLTLKGVDTGSGKPVVDASGSGSTITLSADGIILEGFKATGGSWAAAGIKVISSHNTIRNNNASNNYHGINLDYSGNIISVNKIGNNTITGNIVSSNWKGINLDFSSNNNIAGNTVSSNGDGINLDFSSNNSISGNTFVNDGLNVHKSYENTVKDNTVNGKPLVYLEDVSDTEVTDAGQVILVNCSNILVENLELSTSFGVTLLKTDDSIVANNNICNNRYGIGLEESCNNTISGNTVSNNGGDGIWLDDSCNNNIITGNTFVNEGLNVYFSHQNTVDDNTFVNGGLLLTKSDQNTVEGNTFVNEGLIVHDSYQNIVKGNTVNSKPLVYLEDTSDRAVTDAGQVILVNCNNIAIENLDLSNTYVGVALWGSEDCKISNNTVSNSNTGIYFYSSCNNNITGNTISNNNAGIGFNWHSINNNLTGNTLNNCWGDIYFRTSCSNNKIYLNNFMNNANNVYSYNSSNIWNSPEEITYTYDCSTYTNYLGNYWSDYNEKYPNAEEIDESGIWDTPYNLDSDNDTYPLVMPFVNYFASPPNGPFNIIQHQTTPVQIVLRRQDIQFIGWTSTPAVYRYISGDLQNTYTAVDQGGEYYVFNVNWPVSGDYYVGPKTDAEAQLSVLEPIMNLYSLQGDGVGSSSSIIQGTPLRLDFVTNLDANDLMDLEVLNPEGVLLKTNPADSTQIFDNIKVCELLKYGSMNESKQINTTGWDIGTYTFCIRTEAEHAQGLYMRSATRTLTVSPPENNFDTGPSGNPYPSISGTHNGTIKLTTNILVHTLFTYPCPGTGGHTEYVRIWNSSWAGVEAHGNGYQGDWNNISFNESFILYSGKTYNYCIRTGSYPQIIHESSKEVTGGTINCTEFVDANGKKCNNRIPAIRFFSEVQLTAADNGTESELKKGQSLLITLEANPTTGYQWDLVEPPVEHILQQVGAILFKPDTILPGASGVQTIRFEAVGTGKTALKLVYHRPWETDVAPEEIFYLHVVVNG